MLKSFYNPDHQQCLDYHKELLKVVEQERFINQFVKVDPSVENSQHARAGLFDQFLHFFNFKPHRTLTLKEHK